MQATLLNAWYFTHTSVSHCGATLFKHKKREEIKNKANSRIFPFLELDCLVQKNI